MLQRVCVALARQSVRRVRADVLYNTADRKLAVRALHEWAANANRLQPIELRRLMAHGVAVRYWRLRNLFAGFAKMVAAARRGR